MRSSVVRSAFALLTSAIFFSCSETKISSVPTPVAPSAPNASVVAGPTDLVISQIYGGGGNTGAPYNADFIEIFNPTTSPISVTGWSVQYASATGTSWTVTNLSGTINPGKYYLVGMAAGTNGAALPTRDATGTASMSASAGKVVLSKATASYNTISCPSTNVADFVQYGNTTTAGNCPNQTGTNLSNTTAALRKGGGCIDTNTATSNADDFTAGAPAPRNSSSTANPCQTAGQPATVTVSPLTQTINNGTQQQFTATAKDSANQTTTTTFTWSSDNTSVATVDAASGLATAVGNGTAQIKATASNGVFGTATLTVETPPPPVASVVVTPPSASVDVDATQQYSATAYDASNNPIPGTAFTWSVSPSNVATITSGGLATGTLPGDATVKATAGGKEGTASIHVNPVVLPEVRFSELHYDNFGTDANEKIEIEAPAGTNLFGWSIVLYNGNGGVVYNTAELNAIVPAMCNGRGVVFVAYAQDGIQNGSPDGMALVGPDGVIEFLSYEGTFTATDGPAAGMLSKDIGASEVSATVGTSLRRNAANKWESHSANFGACADDPAPPPEPGLLFSGRLAGDPALPVGFEDQIFATEIGPAGDTIETTITWTSETPALASVDQDGVMLALAEGIATLRATATDGTTATYSLRTRVAVASTTASYAGNTEFGDPTDGDASDDFIIRRDQFTTSFNKNRGIPNWVSFNLEATHFGPEDRCDCFTYDSELVAAGFERYTTAAYTGVGGRTPYHGYSIDRGHLARSFDRTAGTLDNARTFNFANIIPQASDNNQGPWAAAELAIGNMARLDNKEVYIIAGASGSKGTVKDQGKITIPAHTWKVAVIMPRNQGLSHIDDASDFEVIALIMPNDAGIRGVAWENYKTTVDAVEELSGYDLLSLLPDQIEIAVESNTQPPVAAVDGPYTSAEGSSVSMSGAASTDPDNDDLTYTWDFGDGSSASGSAVSHTYANDGTYTVQLTVTDERGLIDVVSTSATVANVAPSVASFAGATLLPGETYSASGSFTDPGSDSWTATVDYGDGSGTNALSLSGMNFSLSHTYNAAGTFTVTVAVNDDDTSGNNAATVTVLTPVQALNNANALLDQLVADGKLAANRAGSLRTKINAAIKKIDKGDTTGALSSLESTIAELDAHIKTGRITADDAAPLRALLQRVIDSIS